MCLFQKEISALMARRSQICPITLHGRVVFRENKVSCAVKGERNEEMCLSKKIYIIIDHGVLGRMDKTEHFEIKAALGKHNGRKDVGVSQRIHLNIDISHL